ncbi:MAG: NADH-quinone oxidoreductase subunit NuoG [Deltaproteobacteria bacterium]|nr:NADH-quinone oxidoreductase subunit NuoG [Deltaproteobacteria bacterium]
MMVRLVIDGKQIKVDGHINVLTAARKLGIHIPTFCHHPMLSELGACRMCLVEVEGMGKLQTACTLAVLEGMEVRTDTPRVQKARRMMLEFLLINHPLECTVCDASGECTLQDLAFKFGSGETRFSEKKRVLRDHIISPLIDRNLNRCIQCKRCVRICDEVQGVTALGMSYRGAQTVVGPFMEKSLDCEYCGHCIWACPAGAITSRAMKETFRTWEMDKMESICPFCSMGCTLLYNHRENRVLKVTNAENRGINNGSLCSRGFFGYDVINNPERLKTPLIRKDGELVEVSWDEALAAVAQGFGGVKKSGGGSAIGGIVSDRLTNEELYLFQKVFRVVLESNNVDTPSGNWTRVVLPILEKRLGVFAAPNSIDELNYVDSLLLVGCDITVESPIAGLKVKSAIKKGALVTELMPRSTALSRLAARTILIDVGNEVAFIKGMMRVMLEEELVDVEALADYKGTKALRDSVSGLDLEKIASNSGVSVHDIVQTAREFISAGKSSIIFGEEAAFGPNGDDLINALVDLLMLTGRLGKEGCGLFPVLSNTNFQGVVDMGVSPDHLPGWVPVESSRDRKTLEKAWNAVLPQKPGMNANEIFAAAGDGKLQALYLVGVNPVITFPDGQMVEEALAKVDFLVVQELFLTETASRAHVVLPACGLPEKNGTLTSLDRRVQRSKKAQDGAGKTMPDWRIFSEVGVSMGVEGLKYVNSAEVLDEIAEVVPYYSGISYRILADNGIQWPFTRQDVHDVYSEGYLGTRHLLPDSVPAGKRSFAAVKGWGGFSKNPDYPLTLLIGNLLVHSGSFTRYSESLNQLVNSAVLSMNRVTGAGLEIEDGSRVKVVSPSGEVALGVKYSNDLLPGVLYLPRHFSDVPVSRLMGENGAGLETAVVRVRVEKC